MGDGSKSGYKRGNMCLRPRLPLSVLQPAAAAPASLASEVLAVVEMMALDHFVSFPAAATESIALDVLKDRQVDNLANSFGGGLQLTTIGTTRPSSSQPLQNK
jgi:hypothetical protein